MLLSWLRIMPGPPMALRIDDGNVLTTAGLGLSYTATSAVRSKPTGSPECGSTGTCVVTGGGGSTGTCVVTGGSGATRRADLTPWSRHQYPLPYIGRSSGME